MGTTAPTKRLKPATFAGGRGTDDCARGGAGTEIFGTNHGRAVQPTLVALAEPRGPLDICFGRSGAL